MVPASPPPARDYNGCMEQSLPVTVAAAGLLFFFPLFSNPSVILCFSHVELKNTHLLNIDLQPSSLSTQEQEYHFTMIITIPCLVLYHSNFLKFLHFCKRNISGFKHKMVSVTSRFYTFLCADHALLSTVAQQFPKLSHQEACIKGKGMKPYLGSTFSLVWLSTTPIHKPCLCINTVLGMRL